LDFFIYKEAQSAANDYVCLMIRVNNKPLIDLMGGGCSQLFEVWKNKERLFQYRGKGMFTHRGDIVV
jgi:hypothetical protein